MKYRPLGYRVGMPVVCEINGEYIGVGCIMERAEGQHAEHERVFFGVLPGERNATAAILAHEHLLTGEPTSMHYPRSVTRALYGG